ncbi:hypothetical protein ABZW11_42130 [Nonomuraea sp. NPDC004580]
MDEFGPLNLTPREGEAPSGAGAVSGSPIPSGLTPPPRPSVP